MFTFSNKPLYDRKLSETHPSRWRTNQTADPAPGNGRWYGTNESQHYSRRGSLPRQSPKRRIRTRSCRKRSGISQPFRPSDLPSPGKRPDSEDYEEFVSTSLINPNASQDIALCYLPYDIRIIGIYANVQGINPSMQLSVWYGSLRDFNGATGKIIQAQQITSPLGNTQVFTGLQLALQSIPSGTYLRIKTHGYTSGTVMELHTTIHYIKEEYYYT